MKMQTDLTEDSVQVMNQLAQIDERALQQSLQQIYLQKKAYLQIHDAAQAERLEQLAHEEMLTKQLITEIQEAEEAGEVALTRLGQAAASLHSASGYSTWDTFLVEGSSPLT